MLRPENKTLNSWLMQVLGPVLIMCMVGSLVFFFIEVLYRGPHTARLCWVLGLFTIASVLVSRVSIQEGFDRATLFGLTLAIATFVTSITIVDFDYGYKILEPLALAVLIGLVMWSSSKLTWDCTVVDSSRDVSASGLMFLARRRFKVAQPNAEKNIEQTDSQESTAEPAGANSQFGRGILSNLFSKAGRQNTPGLWVFYFSLMALPIFGFGQWFVVADPLGGYAWIFLLFAVYLGSGLGLLMVTSLLGLDRYLNRRKLQLPKAIAQTWLTIGSLFAVAMMLLVLWIPRPDMSASTSNALAWFSSSLKRSSDKALGKDGQEQKQQGNSAIRSESGQKRPGENAKSPGPHRSRQAAQSQSGSGKGGKGSGQKSNSSKRPRSQPQNQQGQQSATQPSSGKQPARNSDSPQNKQAGKQPGKKSSSSADPKTADQASRNSAESKESSQTSSQRDRRDEQEPPTRETDERDDRPEGNSADKDEKTSSQNETDRNSARSKMDENSAAERGSSRGTNPSGGSASPSTPYSLPSGLSGVAKGFVFLIGLAALFALAWLFRRELADFWANLFGRKKKDSEDQQTGQPVAKPKPPFSEFVDPFESGRHSKLTERQLIHYTYAALQAWARGHAHEKGPDETAYEFARQIRGFDRTVGSQAMELAGLYCRAEYSQQVIHRQELKPLLQLWQNMSTRQLTAV
ncbi:MAG: hypothetical protein P8K79_04895 [Mariniblastus sp.]|nr:hypothetical protein [Mariniblastus sp.]